MSRYDNEKSPNFWLGMGIGAILGVLFAPRSGKETREKMKEDYGRYVEKGNEALNEAKVVYSVARDKVAPIVDEVSGKVAPYVEVLKDVSEPYKEELVEKVKEFIEDTIKIDLKNKKTL